MTASRISHARRSTLDALAAAQQRAIAVAARFCAEGNPVLHPHDLRSVGGLLLLNVAGANTRINAVGESMSLAIGRDGTGTAPSVGTMTIAGGAQVIFPETGTGSVGFTPGSIGTLNVTGAGSRLEMGAFLGIGRDFNDNAGGIGTLNVLAGGTVKATNVHIGSGGTVTGNGTIEGSVINDGVINPGTSPGTLDITGDLTLNDSSILTIEIAGTAPGQYDVINVGGALHVDGTLRVLRSGGYSPALGDDFGIFSFASMTGTFDTVALEGFAPGASFDLTAGPGGFGLQVAAVPEAHEWALMLAGLVMVRLVSLGKASRRAMLV